MAYVILAVGLSVCVFAVAYCAWLSVKFCINKSTVLDRREFGWLLERSPDGSFDLHDDDLSIEDVSFLYRDFDFRKEMSLIEGTR